MISVMLNVYRNHIQFIRDWGRREGSRVRPVRTKETFSAIDRTINVKEVWTTPERSSLCTPQLVLSFQQLCRKKSLRQSPRDQYLEPKVKDSPAHFESPPPPPSSDRSWTLCVKGLARVSNTQTVPWVI